ncbi:NMA1 [Symbiodinium pilosum]|uniref:NMA1 protein n=1 Tax=Symbiodinium pilosum TaxID=2952 RepID=A0A812MDN7_SYMPI|nr:NMA1 [Symbiodinium pilosum]
MQDIQDRVNFVELDATSPDWPVSDSNYDIVLMSYISGSVPESVILPLYKNAFKAD